MNLFGKTYTVVYVDNAAKSTTSDNVSMVYLLAISSGARYVMFFTDFVGIDRSLYSVEAIAFAPLRSFYFSSTLIKNYTNNPDNYSDFVKVNYNGVVQNTNNQFGYVSSIGTKVVSDDTITNANKRALCTVGVTDLDYTYQGRYGEGTTACDELMTTYCDVNPTDVLCSCINYQEYLKETSDIDYKYSALLKPYCHVGACAASGYYSADIIAQKNAGNCPAVNLCIQNANVSDNTILNSNVSLVCKQNNQSTTTTADSSGTGTTTTTGTDTSDTDTSGNTSGNTSGSTSGNTSGSGTTSGTSGSGTTSGTTSGTSGTTSGSSDSGTTSGTTSGTSGTTSGTSSGTTSGTSGSGTTSGSSGTTSGSGTDDDSTTTTSIYVYITIGVLFLIALIFVIFITRRNREGFTYHKELFTLDSTFDDGFVGTNFKI